MQAPSILAAVGDVLVDRADPGPALSTLASLFRSAGLVFGNWEGVLTDTHPALPGASSATIVGTANAAALAPFDVMSLANNHAMDAGYGGLADTVATLARHGVRAVGAGTSMKDALTPYVGDVGGRRVAVLAATSVLHIGVEAGPNRPGVVPLRAEDSYLPRHPGVHTPGVPPRVLSILDENDAERLCAAIGTAREEADSVVVSMHWGDHTQPWVLTEHERLCSELLVEAGADVVLGHHQHMLRGVEFIGDSVVFYGLGHAVFDFPRYPDELRDRGIDIDAMTADELVAQLGEYGIFPRPDSPNFPFHPMARTGAVALVELGVQGRGRCGLVPIRIDDSGAPQPVHRASAEWAESLSVLQACSSRAGLSSRAVDSGWERDGYDVVELLPAG